METFLFGTLTYFAEKRCAIYDYSMNSVSFVSCLNVINYFIKVLAES